jgi:uncharacterized protein (TIGR03435 family)
VSLTRALAIVSLAAVMSSPFFGQVTQATPRFAVADVHVAAGVGNPTPYVTGGVLRGGRYELRQATMMDLIAIAWGVDTDTVLGGPTWLQIDRFDVIAKAPPDTPRAKVKMMLQALLVDRFNLAVRKDTKPLPVVALTRGPGRAKLKPAEGSVDSACQTKREPGPMPVVLVSCRNMTMEEFAGNVRVISAPWIGRPVVDRSGLKGAWDFDFRFTPWSATVAQDGDGITIFEATQKQLGLKLELQKAPAPVLVVDRVNRTPTENRREVMRDIGPSPLTEFEIAVIKPSLPDAAPDLRLQPGGQVDVRALTLKTMIALAWNLDPDTNYMIVGAPKFLDSARFDITAKPYSGGGQWNPAPLAFDEVRVLLQALLKDRFKLATHVDDRTVVAYSLVARKPKLRKANPANPTRWNEGPGPDGKDPRLTNPILTRLVTFQNVTMTQFAELLPLIASGSYLGPVLDDTGLKGVWDFTLSFSSAGLVRRAVSNSEAGQRGEPNGAVSVFDAIDQQLGLKLEMHKRPIPVLVIDHIEDKPTDN